MAQLSLYDLAVLDRVDEFTGMIEDVTTVAPEFTEFEAVKRDGTYYEVVKRVTLPTAQFRQTNMGVTPSKSVFKKEIHQMFNLDVALNVDEAIWKADQARTGTLWQHEAAGATRAAGILIGQQVYYGTSADASGFPGVRSQYAANVAVATGASTTSAYLLWMDPKQGCRFDVGMNGLFDISAPTRQQVADPNNSGKNYFAYVGNLQAWVGFNVLSSFSVFALTGLATTFTTLVYAPTDARGSILISYVPLPRRQNLCWFMNRTTESLLQQTRSTINPGILNGTMGASNTGLGSYQAADAAGRPAFGPLPNYMCGYPIVITDSILNTETN
jgi:hypothetical protein